MAKPWPFGVSEMRLLRWLPGSRVSVIISQLMLICQRRAPLPERSRVSFQFQALTWERRAEAPPDTLPWWLCPMIFFGDRVIYGLVQQQLREVQCPLSRSLVALQCSLCDGDSLTIALPFNDFVPE